MEKEFRRVLRAYVEQTIGRKYLDEITVADVSAWHARLRQSCARAKTTPVDAWSATTRASRRRGWSAQGTVASNSMLSIPYR
jgi:hypothetical protein